MLDDLKRMLGIVQDDLPVRDISADDTQIAIAALMFHAIIIDGVVRPEESVAFKQILSDKFGMDSDDVDALIEEAKKREKEAIDLFQFTRHLKSDLDDKSRRALIGEIWRLVYADGVVHEFEDNIVWRLADLLNVSQEDRIALKLRAKADFQAESSNE